MPIFVLFFILLLPQGAFAQPFSFPEELKAQLPDWVCNPNYTEEFEKERGDSEESQRVVSEFLYQVLSYQLYAFHLESAQGDFAGRETILVSFDYRLKAIDFVALEGQQGGMFRQDSPEEYQLLGANVLERFFVKKEVVWSETEEERETYGPLKPHYEDSVYEYIVADKKGKLSYQIENQAIEGSSIEGLLQRTNDEIILEIRFAFLETEHFLKEHNYLRKNLSESESLEGYLWQGETRKLTYKRYKNGVPVWQEDYYFRGNQLLFVYSRIPETPAKEETRQYFEEEKLMMEIKGKEKVELRQEDVQKTTIDILKKCKDYLYTLGR